MNEGRAFNKFIVENEIFKSVSIIPSSSDKIFKN